MKENKNGTRSSQTGAEEAAATPDEMPFIVGIGASAGGLKALEEFFQAVPVPSDMAYIVLQHLMKEHASMLAEILARKTELTVKTIEDDTRIEPNTVYVSPPQKEVNIYQGKLQLFEPGNREKMLHPIDSFFRALAREAGRKAACVILSGTGTDGTLGLKEINAHNGLCMAQSSDSAEYDGMPLSAIETGFVDYILTPRDMPETLYSYFENYKKGRFELRPEGPWLEKILGKLKEETGHDFSHYKTNTIFRRINRRMNINDIKDQGEYLRYLQQNGEELELLFSELLIGVTSFFREPEAFEILKNSILPSLLKQKRDQDNFRVWVPACSTGEEVYSLAIIFREVFEQKGHHASIQFFASDINPDFIEKARRGEYPESIEADVETVRLHRFFVKENNLYRIKREIRDTVVFSVQNVLKDPPFTNLDLICCRNLLIYLKAEAQKRLIPLFHYSLKEDGFLMLGTSETIGQFSDIFDTVDKNAKIFVRGKTQALDNYNIHFPSSPPTRQKDMTQTKVTQKSPDLASEPQLRDYILSEVAPVSILINTNDEIQYITGDAGKYLKPAEGYPSQNIHDMLREGLQVELSTAVSRAKKENKQVVRKQLQVKTNGGYEYVDITIQPVPDKRYAGGGFLIIFHQLEKPKQSSKKEVKDARKNELESRIADLEKELQETRESHQATVEELETSNEEVKSMNEELQSSNEELQSTNEELESSKEELQSLNEELTTVNNELQEKVEELSDARDDMNNLLNSTNIAAVFLDNNMRIKRYTPATENLTNFIQSDVGRPFHHISHHLKYDRLKEDIKKVMKTLQSEEAEVESKDGKWYKMKVLPYKTKGNVIEGAVITFYDITDQKLIQRKLQLALDFSDNIIDAVREAVLIFDSGLKIVEANYTFYSTFNIKEKDTVGKRFFDLNHGAWDADRIRDLIENRLEEKSAVNDFEFEAEFPRVGKKKLLINARKFDQKPNREVRYLLVLQEVQ